MRSPACKIIPLTSTLQVNCTIWFLFGLQGNLSGNSWCFLALGHVRLLRLWRVHGIFGWVNFRNFVTCFHPSSTTTILKSWRDAGYPLVFLPLSCSIFPKGFRSGGRCLWARNHGDRHRLGLNIVTSIATITSFARKIYDRFIHAINQTWTFRYRSFHYIFDGHPQNLTLSWIPFLNVSPEAWPGLEAESRWGPKSRRTDTCWGEATMRSIWSLPGEGDDRVWVGICWDILGYVPICWNTCETSDLDNCEHKFLKVVSNIVEVERTILNCHNLSSGSMSLSFFRRRSSKSFIVRLAASNWPEMGHVPT